ncbi:MAG: hypothetical protein U0W40_16410 [Acidimicrobiia bacterium]
MSKFARRSLLLAMLVALAVPFAATASSAQQVTLVSLTVGKTVVGTGTGPSQVTLDCVAQPQANAAALGDFSIVFTFDAQGKPVSATNPAVDIVGNQFRYIVSLVDDTACTFTETATGGATSTTWGCDYDFTPVKIPQAEQIQIAGCQAASGTGVGPVTVLLPGAFDVSDQDSTVTFTNTFTPAPPVVQSVAVQPTFTG